MFLGDERASVHINNKERKYKKTQWSVMCDVAS